VELNASAAFKALLGEAMASYYDSPAVLAALGWRVASPQPHGHDVAPGHDTMLQLLDKVRARGPLWRA
jgi:hypothetical protein